MMSKRIAADYCGLSIAAFEKEMLAGRLPTSVPWGGREQWRKSAIDKALDHLTGDGAVEGEPEYRKKLRERYAS